jgi:hypothetical protein
VSVHPEVVRLSLNNETVELKVCLLPPAPRDYQVCSLQICICMDVCVGGWRGVGRASGRRVEYMERLAFELRLKTRTNTICRRQGLSLVFTVRGGRNLRLPIIAEAIVPEISLVQPPGM